MKLIAGGMIGNSIYIGTSLNGLIQELKLKVKTLFSFFNFFTYIKVIERLIGLSIQPLNN